MKIKLIIIFGIIIGIAETSNYLSEFFQNGKYIEGIANIILIFADILLILFTVSRIKEAFKK